MRKIVLSAAMILGLLAVPATASALEFVPATDSPLVGAESPTVPSPLMPPGYPVTDVATGDFNDDGFDDVAVVSESSRDIYVYMSNGDGTLEPSLANPIGSNSPEFARTTILADDVDGDGAVDLVSITTTQTLEVYRNRMIDLDMNGEWFGTVPTFSLAIPLPTLAGYRSTSMGDVDGDEDADLAVGLYDNSYDILENLGDGTFASMGRVEVPRSNAGDFDGITSTTLGDFDGDGNADLAMVSDPEWVSEEVGAGPDRLLLAKSEGDGSFATPVQLAAGAGLIYLGKVEAADVNGDEYEDLIYEYNDQSNPEVGYVDQVRTALGGPSGLTLATGPDSRVRIDAMGIPSVADFDGDGSMDVAVPRFVDSSFDIALGDGDGGLAVDPAGPFQFPEIPNFDPDDTDGPATLRFLPEKGAPLDLNGDGAMDYAALSGHAGDPDRARGLHIMINTPFPAMEADTESIDFGSVQEDASEVPTQTVTITSTGTADLNFGGATIGGAEPSRFRISGGTCRPGIVASGDECTVEISPVLRGGQGPLSATLDLTSDAASGTLSIPLSIVVEPHGDPPVPQAHLALKVKSAKKVRAGRKLLVTVTVRNTGDAGSGPVALNLRSPKNAARKVKAQKTGGLGVGKSAVRRFRVPVKKNARGRFWVFVTAQSGNQRIVERSAGIKVLKAKKKRRR